MSLFEKRAPAELRAETTTLTDDFDGEDAAASAAAIAVDNESMVTLAIDYGVGTGGTGVEVLPEVLLQGDADDEWRPASSMLDTGSPAGGYLPSTAYGATYLVAAGRRLVDVRVLGASKLRVRCRELGAVSVAGSCRVRAVASRAGA